MALHNANFTYIGKNSEDEGFIVTSFEPDDGFKDTFLSMEPVYEESRHGESRFDYGARYNAEHTVEITIIKRDFTDFSVHDVRQALKWLTGSRVNSWMEIFCGKRFQYAFLGRVTDVKQRKLDSRVIGLMIVFTSICPWAFSNKIEFDRSISKLLNVDNDPVNKVTTEINNRSDDLYTYINLNARFENNSCSWLEIVNNTTDETTRINNIKSNEVIDIVDKQFIVAYLWDYVSQSLKNTNRIFGQDFNFVWPKLTPGMNSFTIRGDGNGKLKFSYRYPIKIGDCAIDDVDDVEFYILNNIMYTTCDDVLAFIEDDKLVANGSDIVSLIENDVLVLQ